MTDLFRLAKLLNSSLEPEQVIKALGENVSIEGEVLEPAERDPRERVIANKRWHRKKRNETPKEVFITIAVLITVERDWEYEVWLMTENLSKWKQNEPERSWDISYVKSMPREFTGTPWYAWGYPGFTDEGIFSGTEYGFLDTIPTRAQLGVPALLHTKTLDVNQQLGISTPLFWDEDNPAPLTKTKVNFSLTDAWLSGFFTDNYLEITHLYEDRYDALSFASGREKFPDDWWIYPYFQKDVDIDHLVFDIPVDIYRYAYSPSGAVVEFDNLSSEEYVTVVIPLYRIDLITKLPELDEDGNPIIATSAALTSELLVVEDEWRRTNPETCQEPTGRCIAETQVVESDLRDFGVGVSWDIGCFNQGQLKVMNGESVEATIAVSQMPVSIQWDTVPAKLLITGIPDSRKTTPTSLESGTPVTLEFEAPYEYSSRTEPEIKFKWSSSSIWKEINAGSYALGHETVPGTGQWTISGTLANNVGGTIGQPLTLSFSYTPQTISGNFGRYVQPSPGIDDVSQWHLFYPGAQITTIQPTYLPYISLFAESGTVKDYGTTYDIGISYGSTQYFIGVQSSSDTVVTVNGSDYWFASTPTITTSQTEQLTVYQNGVQIHQETFDARYPVILHGIQDIAEYKNFSNNASIRFTRQFPGEPVEDWSWHKSGVGDIEVDQVTGDCEEEGRFVYDKRTLKGKLGVTTITEQDSEREPEILYKYIPYRENGDEILNEEVTPELSLTYVHAGGKIYSGVHSKDVLVKWELKGVCDPSPNHQYVTIRNYFYNDDLEFIRPLDARVIRPIVSPRENQQRPWWGLLDFPPLVTTTNYSASVPGDPPDISVGETIQYIGTFDSEPESAGGSAWQATLMASYLINENGNIDYEDVIDPQTGIQWSNHHEYFVGRKRTYWGTNISGRNDETVWLNGWEPINTVGLTGQLPSGEFRSLSLRHETTPAKLTYGIKGVIDTVQGANKEPLHFVFAYGAHYAVFGKVNNGLNDDEDAVMLKSEASDDLGALLFNKQQQISQNPPYPAPYSYNLLMKASGYSWGGFKNYVAPYTPGLFNEVHSINKQLPELYLSWPAAIDPRGIESQFSIGFKYVDPSETYTITIAENPVSKTGFSSRTELLNSFISELQGVAPPGVSVSASGGSIVIAGDVSVEATPSGGITGLDVLVETNDELTIPGQTQSISTYRIYFPGINAPYSLSIDGAIVPIGVSNAMSKDSALQYLFSALGAYNTEISDDYVTINNGVYEVFPVEPKDYNDIQVIQTIVATESTDRSWRESEIKWDSTPTCGVPESTPLEQCSTANVSADLEYDEFDYATYPYAKIDITLNPQLFSVHDSELLDLQQPNRLLDQDFIGEQSLVVEYSKNGTDWEEKELSVKKIKASWFGAERDKVNIVAIAPSAIASIYSKRLSKMTLGGD